MIPCPRPSAAAPGSAADRGFDVHRHSLLVILTRDRIREALDKRRGQQPPAQVIREAAPDLPGYLPDHALLLEFGGLTINHQAGKATCLGLPLELNGPEFRLLCYLVQQAPRPISAVELLLEGAGYRANDRQADEIVNQHFLRIQEKLDLLGCSQVNIRRLPEGYSITNG